MLFYQAAEKTMSVYLVCLVCLVERNKPNEQDRLEAFFSILLYARLPIPQREVKLNQAIRPHPMLP